MMLSEEEQAIMAKFRALPEPKREEIIDLATNRLIVTMGQFMTKVSGLKGFSDKEKQQAIESIYGPLQQSEEEALKDDSQFSKSFDIGLIASIIQIMQENENPDPKTSTK